MNIKTQVDGESKTVVCNCNTKNKTENNIIHLIKKPTSL